MENQKRFQKKPLNRDDYKGMERVARALKHLGGFTLAVTLIVKNKGNLKKLGSQAVDIASKVIKL